MPPKILKALVATVVVTTLLWASGIAPAIIPQAVPTGNKRGNSTVFQLATGAAPAANDCAKFDGNGNLVTAGAACGAGGGITTVFGQAGPTVDIPVTTTDIATPANPGAGTTKWYTKGGKMCSLSPAGSETCTGGSGTTYPFLPAGPFTLPPTVGGSWTKVNDTSLTPTDVSNGMMVTLAGTGGTGESLAFWGKAYPAAPFTFTIGVWPMFYHTFFCYFGIGLYDSGSGKFVQHAFQLRNSNLTFINIAKYTNSTTFNGDYVQAFGPQIPLPYFLRFTDDGTNRIFSASMDGINFDHINTATIGNTDFMTPTHIGFTAGQSTTSVPTTQTHVRYTIFHWTGI